MKRLDDFTARRRETSPPGGRSAAVEREVMARISQGVRARPRLGARVALAGGFALLCAVALIAVTSVPTRPAAKPQPDFTESVVILDDHVCIWLEPYKTPGKGATRP